MTLLDLVFLFLFGGYFLAQIYDIYMHYRIYNAIKEVQYMLEEGIYVFDTRNGG
jgi:hypothetical protein